jgi:hypothetical protein
VTTANSADAAPKRRWPNQLLLALAGIGLGLLFAGAIIFDPWFKGFAFYHGYLTLPAQIAGQDFDLPVRASQCVNCHDAERVARDRTLRLVPLNRGALTEPGLRRGGPQTVYTEASFCSLMRTGVDPASVLINRTMPRFALTDQNCNALWTYLMSL